MLGREAQDNSEQDPDRHRVVDNKTLIASGRFYQPKCNSRGTAALLRVPVSAGRGRSSYYAMPKPEVAELWAKRTPPDFTFNITGIQFQNGVEVRSQGRRKVAA